jgi:tetratricopeptide (TPR) repeat protein
MNSNRAILVLGFLCCIGATIVKAGVTAQHARIKEYTRVFTTYPYSDPDPVAAMSRYYPYFRYDGYTEEAVQKNWKVVELCNEYLQLLILPEIGGKIWAAVEREKGRSFIYFNHVVKFRDVSMRGPWTSGGMEANYGIMGHTPNCFSPVDYVTRRNSDGSVSCIIGALDLITRTTWRLEINLPADQACFSTRSTWHNGSGAEQPYYTWMNVGIKAHGDLQLIYPGNRFLGHDGKSSDWPWNPEKGRDLSWYRQNDFGSYKSYHVFGRLSAFFGGYYHEDDFGIAHYADYSHKPGRKIWIWGQSREGMIWERLLTDADGQYVEIQSGRLFNQTADESSLTPFKHKGFPPYATDSWTEYWQPVNGTQGFVTASPWGAMNVTHKDKKLTIRISPVRQLREKLEVYDGDKLLWWQRIALKPMKTVVHYVPLAEEPKALRVVVGGNKLCYDAAANDLLSRPLKSPKDFDWDSGYGLYLRGRENVHKRAYLEAETNMLDSLRSNPNFLPALVEMAALSNRKADWARARDYSQHALSIDTYDPAANYQYGLCSVGLGSQADAEDAFSIAALSAGWRSAAFTEMAKLHLRQKQYDRALMDADAALDSNQGNVDAMQLKACIGRICRQKRVFESACRTLLERDPLNHFARFENFLRGEGSLGDFTKLIRNELPQETYLELAAWYRNAGLESDAARVLEIAPPTGEVLYWLAYLQRNTNLLSRAESASPAFVFPFRTEAIPVFEWACGKSASWQPRYYLSLIRWFQGDAASARALLLSCEEQPQFAPFYAARAQVIGAGAAHDLAKAAQMDPAQWRYGWMLAKHHLTQTNSAAALAVARQYNLRFPTNTVIALVYAKTLVLDGQSKAAIDLLSRLRVLPSEGSIDARALLREARLMLAVEEMKKGLLDVALQHIVSAREWPENLGAGKPYAADIDERLEDWLAFQCEQSRNPTQAQFFLSRILSTLDYPKGSYVGPVIRALALEQSGRSFEVSNALKPLAMTPDNERRFAFWVKEALARRATSFPLPEQDSDARILAAWARLGASL